MMFPGGLAFRPEHEHFRKLRKQGRGGTPPQGQLSPGLCAGSIGSRAGVLGALPLAGGRQRGRDGWQAGLQRKTTLTVFLRTFQLGENTFPPRVPNCLRAFKHQSLISVFKCFMESGFRFCFCVSVSKMSVFHLGTNG